VNQHILTSFICNFIQKFNKHNISLGCKMNVCVLELIQSSIGGFNIVEKQFKDRTESGPNDLVDFMKISVENVNFSLFHQLLKLICDQRYQKERYTIKAFVAL